MSQNHTLKFPVKIGDLEYTEIVVERPKGGLLREMSKLNATPGEKDFWLMGRICHAPGAEGGIPDEVVNEMDGSDIVAISAIMQGFLSSGR